jgi:sarcosine oxidase
MDDNHFDVIVVGLGGWGGSCAWHLARRGLRVLGLDRYSPPHERGSSHGLSRIGRLGSPEHPAYTPLMARCFELWDELGRASGREVIRRTGGISFGPPEHELIAGAVEAYAGTDRPYRILEGAEARRAYPWLALEPGEVVLHDDSGAVFFPEETVEAQLAQAARAGAELRTNELVTDWQADERGVSVTTPRDTFAADWLVLALGSWLPDLLRAEIPFYAERQVMLWWQPAEHPEWFAPEVFPFFLGACEPPYELSFAVPGLHGEGIKLGMHRGGEIGHPETIERAVRPEDVEVARREIARRVPALAREPIRTRVCVYENTPDRHFLVGPHPAHPRVLLAGGGSGRGFKFAPLIGELVADLIEGQRRDDLAILSPGRFGQT